MKQRRSAAESVDEYITEFPVGTREVLREMRALIQAAAPDAGEKISYAIPTFMQGGNLVHFAGYEHHVGFYPGAATMAAFQGELMPYKSAKGSVQFPVGQPLPTDLISRMVEFSVADRLATLKGKAKAKPKPPKKGKRK